MYNFRFIKSQPTSRTLYCLIIFLTSRLRSRCGTISPDWCLVLCPFAETYPIKTETCPQLLKSHIHSYKQMQSVAKLASISRSWPLKSMGTSQHKAFSTYYNARQFYTAAPYHRLDRWESEGCSSSTESIRSNHGFAIHSQGVELPDFTVSTWYWSSFYLYHICLASIRFELICELGKYCFSNFALWITTTSSYPKLSAN